MRFPSLALLAERAVAVARGSRGHCWPERSPPGRRSTRWTESARRQIAPALGGLLALGGFHAVWPGIDQKHEVIRYFQLSAVAHLAVAFLPLTARATRSPSGSQSG